MRLMDAVESVTMIACTILRKLFSLMECVGFAMPGWILSSKEIGRKFLNLPLYRVILLNALPLMLVSGSILLFILPVEKNITAPGQPFVF